MNINSNICKMASHYSEVLSNRKFKFCINDQVCYLSFENKNFAHLVGVAANGTFYKDALKGQLSNNKYRFSSTQSMRKSKVKLSVFAEMFDGECRYIRINEDLSCIEISNQKNAVLKLRKTKEVNGEYYYYPVSLIKRKKRSGERIFFEEV